MINFYNNLSSQLDLAIKYLQSEYLSKVKVKINEKRRKEKRPKTYRDKSLVTRIKRKREKGKEKIATTAKRRRRNTNTKRSEKTAETAKRRTVLYKRSQSKVIRRSNDTTVTKMPKNLRKSATTLVPRRKSTAGREKDQERETTEVIVMIDYKMIK